MTVNTEFKTAIIALATILNLQGMSSSAFTGENHLLVDEFTTPLRNSSSSAQITSIEVGDCDDIASIFNDPQRFPRLKTVYLRSPSFNEPLLLKLSQNYPYLSRLSVEQTKPLTVNGVASISSFKRLKKLALSCAVSGPNPLTAIKTRDLRSLSLCNSDVSDATLQSLRTLPKLKELCLRNVKVNGEFLTTLSAPSLTTLFMDDVAIKPGAMGGLSRFKELRSLVIGSNVEASDLNVLSRLPKLRSLFLPSSESFDQPGEASRAVGQIHGLTELGMDINGEPEAWLVGLSQLHNLRRISFHCALDCNSAKKLTQMSGLEEIDLSRCTIGPGVLKSLSRLPRLKCIDLSKSNANDQMVDEVDWDRLHIVLNLRGSAVTKTFKTLK